jgi:hypothetical protein
LPTIDRKLLLSSDYIAGPQKTIRRWLALDNIKYMEVYEETSTTYSWNINTWLKLKSATA